MCNVASQLDTYVYLKSVLVKGSNMSDRDRLKAIVDAEIFNMKTICSLAGVKYQTYRNSRSVDFENASDKWVALLLDAIDNILSYYPN